MIVASQVENVEEHEFDGMMILHTATLLASEANLFLMQAPQHNQPSRMLYTSLHPASMPCIVKIITTQTLLSHRCFTHMGITVQRVCFRLVIAQRERAFLKHSTHDVQSVTEMCNPLEETMNASCTDVVLLFCQY